MTPALGAIFQADLVRLKELVETGSAAPEPAAVQLHLVDATYELFRAHFAPRPPVLGSRRDPVVGRVRAVSTSCSTCCARRARPTSAAPRTGSSSRSATTSTRATSRRPGCRPSCSPSSRSPRPRSRRSGSCSGRWSSSRPTTRSPPPRPRFAEDPRVEKILVCTPDKDMAQLVRDDRDRALGPAPRPGLRRRRRAREVGRAADCRSPTGSASSATRRTAFPGSPAGAPSRRRPC